MAKIKKKKKVTTHMMVKCGRGWGEDNSSITVGTNGNTANMESCLAV